MLPEINSETARGNLGLEQVLIDLRKRMSWGFGLGNIYYVIKDNALFYGEFHDKFQQTYDDGSVAVHPDNRGGGQSTGIHSALSATVAGRNDHVVVMPSSAGYDSYYAYLMNKDSVHLIAPAGFGYNRGANTSTVLKVNSPHTEDANIVISAHGCEVAGFRMWPYQDESNIKLEAGAHGPNIHHNTFALSWGAGTIKASLLGETSGGAWGKIERNCFWSTAGNAKTCAAIVSIAANATGCQVNFNEFVIGDDNIATLCINNLAVKGMTNYNLFSESGGNGVANGGTITNAINISTCGSAIGNLGAVATGQLLSGGTAAIGFCQNFDGVDNSAKDGSIQA